MGKRSVPFYLVDFYSFSEHPKINAPLQREHIIAHISWYKANASQDAKVAEIPSIHGIAIVEKLTFNVFVDMKILKGYRIRLTIHPFHIHTSTIDVEIDLRKHNDVTVAIAQQTGIYLSLNLMSFWQYHQDN